MNRRILTIISCALVLSVCASYLVYRAIGDKGNGSKQVRTTPVVIAARDLDAGSLIRSMDVTTASWAGPLPKGAIAKADGILNRGVALPIYEGEPITEARLAHQGSGGGLAGIIPTGMRACAVKVNEVVGVAGFVVPGMRVDVLISGLPPGGNPLDGPKVKTLLQNIAVLSAGTDFQRDQSGKPEQAQVVNLLVTPADAEILSLASNEMHIQLVLRNPMDTAILRPPGTMVSSLFGGAQRSGSALSRADMEAAVAQIGAKTDQNITRVRPAVPSVVVPSVAARPYVVEVLNGSVHSEARFNSTDAQTYPEAQR